MNNSGFYVERSTDNETWQQLDFVQGHGTTDLPQQYRYVDDLSGDIASLGTVYYRLCQLDRDGKRTYSSVVAIVRLNPNSPVADAETAFLLTPYPNPFFGGMHGNAISIIPVKVDMEQPITLYITDAAGKVVQWIYTNETLPAGSYRREFVVPTDWAGRRVFITFDGVDSAFFLWVNGQRVGYSTDSRIPAEFDLTKFVKPPGQTNMLAVEVWRYSAGSYLECQDMWRLSGIFRNVTLWAMPNVHIRDFFVKTDLDKQYKDATVEVTAKVKNYGDMAQEAGRLHLQLLTGKFLSEAGYRDTTITFRVWTQTLGQRYGVFNRG